MHRFYVPAHRISGDQAYLVGDQQRQIKNVLRLRPGDVVALFDGSGREYIARIESTAERKVAVTILDIQHPRTEPPVRLTVALSLLKGRNTDLALQKCTETGAAEFLLIEARRTVRRVEEARVRGRLERWRAIVREAAEQSGRVRVPEVVGVLPFCEALARVNSQGRVFIAWEQEKTLTLLEALRERPGADTAYIVGPEGGFTSEEIAEAEKAGAVPVSLGPRTMRSETAAIVGSALIVLHSEA